MISLPSTPISGRMMLRVTPIDSPISSRPCSLPARGLASAPSRGRHASLAWRKAGGVPRRAVLRTRSSADPCGRQQFHLHRLPDHPPQRGSVGRRRAGTCFIDFCSSAPVADHPHLPLRVAGHEPWPGPSPRLAFSRNLFRATPPGSHECEVSSHSFQMPSAWGDKQ